MDTYVLLVIIFCIALLLFLLALSAILFLKFRERSERKKLQVFKSYPPPFPQGFSSSMFSSNDEEDITSFETKDISESGLFSVGERRMEYKRRGKSPSGVIDGVYNDMYRENGRPYSDVDRDWDADA